MNLPDLSRYRSNFEKNGVRLPLPTVPVAQEGLLTILPGCPGQTGWPWAEQVNPSVYMNRALWPKLTIVTPSYNQDQFLEQTIRSVLLQNYPNLEYIIIDGGSTDNSKHIIKKYSPWISYWQIKKDKGQGNAINLGFSLSSGDYHAWINSDDYYPKGTFIKVIKTFLATKVDFIYGYGYGYGVKEQKLDFNKILPFTDYFIKIPTLIQPSTFWSSRIHEPIWEELHCALDYELWFRLVKGHKRFLIKEPLSVANVHDEAKTMNPGMKQKWDEDQEKIWSHDGHGPIPEWKRLAFLHRVWSKVYRALGL